MLAVPDKAYSIQGSMIGRAEKNGPQGNGINEDVSFTLNTTDRHAVAFACNQRDEVRDMKDKSGALQAQPGMKQQTFIATKVYGIDQQGGKGGANYTVNVMPSVLSDSHGTPHAVAYGICSDGSNSMKSGNPHSGIYEADTTRTLDQNGGNPACNQGGMAIVQCIEPGALSRGQGERVWDKCPTLRANMGDNQPAIVYSIETYHCENHEEKASTLKARDWKDPQCITQPTYALDRASFDQGKNAQFDFQISEDDKTQTVVSRGPNAVAEPPRYSVRRLTPLECERLQGFPDGWTDIPGQTEATEEELEFWREVWLTWDKTQAEDPEKVKPRTDKRLLKWLKNPVSDSAQYKALGNSVAVPCPEYVIEGISEVLSTER